MYNQYLQLKAVTESCDNRAFGNAVMEGYVAIYESAITESIKDKLLGIFKKSATTDDSSEKKECASAGKEILQNVKDSKLGGAAKAVLTTIAMGILLSAGSAHAGSTPDQMPDLDEPSMELATDDPAIHNNKLSTGYGGNNPRNAIASTETNGIKYILYSNNDMSAAYPDGTSITVHPSGNIDVCQADGSGIVGGHEGANGKLQGGDPVSSGCLNFDDYEGTGSRFANANMHVNDASHEDYMNMQREKANKFASSRSHGHTKIGDRVWGNLNHADNSIHSIQHNIDGPKSDYMVNGNKVSYDEYLNAKRLYDHATKVRKSNPHSIAKK